MCHNQWVTVLIVSVPSPCPRPAVYSLEHFQGVFVVLQAFTQGSHAISTQGVITQAA